MDDETPRKPWWKRKRWRLALVVWLALPALYVAGYGPAMYCSGRGWVSDEEADAAYAPMAWERWRQGGSRWPGWYQSYIWRCRLAGQSAYLASPEGQQSMREWWARKAEEDRPQPNSKADP